MLRIQEHSKYIPLAQPPQNTPKTLRPLHNGPTPAPQHSATRPNKKAPADTSAGASNRHLPWMQGLARMITPPADSEANISATVAPIWPVT